LDSRKYQLQKQIIEALKANDKDLYALLKSQWAHRFGVESLEELKSLDFNELNQNQTNVDADNQKIDQSKEKYLEDLKEDSIKEYDNQDQEPESKELEMKMDNNNQDFKIQSYEIVDKEKNENKVINSVKTNRSQAEIKALIPLPPKPKYGFLNKWLVSK
tara:strand:- start:43 stop:522 length:480 start_codon:yes stop_codon:yes gene_type:complete